MVVCGGAGGPALRTEQKINPNVGGKGNEVIMDSAQQQCINNIRRCTQSKKNVYVNK